MIVATEKQREIIEADPASRLIVIGSPGAGKTEVLAARIAYLIEQRGLNSADDLLVLSFSRTAVREVKRRLGRTGGRVTSGIRVSTFDSYATRALSLYATDGDWEGESYDGRIRRAAALLDSSTEYREEVAAYRHVLIDEVQDLVGDRAEFVCAIFRCTRSGFTLLGDPVQGIFNFQLASSASALSAPALLREVASFTPAPEIVQLDENFRAKTAVLQSIAEVGHEMRRAVFDSGAGSESLRDRLSEIVRALDAVNERALGMMLRPVAADAEQSAALLCRYNGQALMISSRLYGDDVPHRLQQAAEDQAVAPWVAEALFGYSYASLSREQFDKRIGEVVQPHPDPAEAWRLLKGVEGGDGCELRLTRLASRIRVGPVPEDMAVVPAANIVVSTVHRAKGLEWDSVGLCGLDGALDDDEETRVLYVALTRAREYAFVVTLAPEGYLSSREQADERCVRWDPRARRTTQIEILSDDVHGEDPGGAFLLREDPAELQDRLRRVRSGDVVDLVLFRRSVDGVPRAFYRIDCEGKSIGGRRPIRSRRLCSTFCEGNAPRAFRR